MQRHRKKDRDKEINRAREIKIERKRNKSLFDQFLLINQRFYLQKIKEENFTLNVLLIVQKFGYHL